jgi:hypothetical protein
MRRPSRSPVADNGWRDDPDFLRNSLSAASNNEEEGLGIGMFNQK